VQKYTNAVCAGLVGATQHTWLPSSNWERLLAPRLAKWFDEVNIDQSLLSGLLEAIMDHDGSFGLELRLGVCEWVLVQNHELHDISLKKSSINSICFTNR